MLKPYLEVNQTTTCFFDPTRCGEVEFEKGYTWWYWFIWSFPTLSILILLNYWTFVGLNTYFDDHKKALIGYLGVWWVIIFPLVFLLPISVGTRTDQVDPTSKNVVLAIAFIFMGIAMGVMGYAYYLLRGGSMTMAYFFTGKKEGGDKYVVM
jgi:hypothetical protein